MGMAGPAMRAVGVQPVLRTEDLSVMGFTEVLGHLPRIMRMLDTIRTALSHERPDAVVLIDAPDFHFRVARIAHSLGIPVLYYISPKLWAWREGRVCFIRKYVQRLISILPFEVDFYARHGMHIDYVGHPLLDAVRTPEILSTPPHARRIGIVPGSRAREVSALMPIFARTATLLQARIPDLEFVLPVAPGLDVDHVRALWTAEVPLQLVASQDRYPVMRSCRAILAASGTATLETALLEVPTAVAYTFSRFSFWLGTKLVKIPYISLPNLILDHPVFPEFLQHHAQPWALAAAVEQWIFDTQARADVLARLAALPDILGGGGAVQRAAAIVCAELVRHNTPQHSA
ncbi:lipid-A-disaccharide synthase [Desulfovibrionales bacterium]